MGTTLRRLAKLIAVFVMVIMSVTVVSAQASAVSAQANSMSTSRASKNPGMPSKSLSRQNIYSGQCTVAAPQFAFDPDPLQGVTTSAALFVAWTGCDTSHHVNVNWSYDGFAWNPSNKVTLTDTAQLYTAPAITYCGGRLYLAWAGTDNIAPQGHHVWMGSFTGGPTLANHIMISDYTANSPALACNGQLIYLGMRTYTSPYYILYQEGYTPSTFDIRYESVESTSYGIGLTAHNGQVYVAWAGRDSNATMNVGYLTGTVVSNKDILAGTSSSGDVGLAQSTLGGLDLAFGGTDGYHSNGGTLLYRSPDGFSWSDITTVNAANSPASVVNAQLNSSGWCNGNCDLVGYIASQQQWATSTPWP